MVDYLRGAWSFFVFDFSFSLLSFDASSSLSSSSTSEASSELKEASEPSESSYLQICELEMRWMMIPILKEEDRISNNQRRQWHRDRQPGSTWSCRNGYIYSRRRDTRADEADETGRTTVTNLRSSTTNPQSNQKPTQDGKLSHMNNIFGA